MGEEEKKTDLTRNFRFVLRDGDMSAYIIASRPDPGVEYSREDFFDALEKNGINTGIRESRISAILKKKIYGREVLVAEGTPVKNGEDGYFEYRFEVNTKDRKPSIREDGSVDYTSINAISCVNEGDVLAVYHPPVQGEAGQTVRGRVVMPKPAKDVRPFMTVGCSYNENTRMYIANISGRVELNNNKLSVLNFRELQQDIDNVYGNVTFNGDILIHGSVKPGVKIVAERTVTIDGSLEGSEVIAKGDVLIRGGVMGAGNARVESDGDIMMDFVEYATIKAKGNIRANSFLDSKVEADGEVHATGKLGAIVGGSVFGLSLVECMFAGNSVGTRTLLATGIRPNVQKEKNNAERELKVRMEAFEKLKAEAEEIERTIRLGNGDDLVMDRKQAMMREKIELDSRIKQLRERIAEIDDAAAAAAEAKITVTDTAFTGCIIQVDQQQMVLSETKRKVEFAVNHAEGGNLSVKPIVEW